MTRLDTTAVEAQESGATRKAERLSILHVVAPAPFGGLESVLRALAAGHTRSGHTVRVALVLSPDDRPHPFASALEADGIAISPILVGDRNYPGERRAVRALCRSCRPDVVHTHGFRPDVVDGPVARVEGVAIVSTCHGFIDAGWRGRIYQWLQRRSLRRFDAIVAVSAPIADRVRAAGVSPSKVHLVPNVFSPTGGALSRDAARARLQLPDLPTIGWVGRLSPEKGPDIAIEALAELGRTDVRLVMIGAGREESQLRRIAAQLQVADLVLWRGVIADAATLSSAFDAFLLSSRSEGTPIALLEAMAAGIPIVATRVGGVPDMLDESSARLVPKEDVKAMADALRDVLEEPEAALARAGRARRRANDTSTLESWLLHYESIYRAVLQAHAEGRT